MKIIKLYFIVFCTLFILPYSMVMAYEEAISFLGLVEVG